LLSPITRRILIVNALALGLLAVGILYLGEYRRSLIKAELDSLTTYAEMFGAALAEGAVAVDTPGSERFVASSARQILYRLVETSHVRARLFSADGSLLIDSRRLGGPNGTIQREELEPPGDEGPISGALFDLYYGLLYWLPGREDMPPYIETPLQHAIHYDEVMAALQGERARMLRAKAPGRMVLSVAVPVQRYKHVLGAVMLSKGSEDIEAVLLDVRLEVLKIFGVALAVTVLLSIYLAGTIARPLNRLAAAADMVRHGAHRQHTIPDLSDRNDEIGDLSGALREMTEALRLRTDAIERFAADVAHEIKNPLTSLRSAVETAARVADEQARRRLMEVIEEDVQRLDRLISDISDASRLDSELSREETAPLDIVAMLRMLVGMHDATGASVSPRLVLQAKEGKTLKVPGIEARLVQVFRNVIGNAISFSPPRGTIVVRVARQKEWVVVTIEDEGPGLPEGKEAAIFERFYTERPAGEKFGTHSGLGLSISKQIVEAHGGTISAENRRDAEGHVIGARFIVRLPAS
jgi:two-component system sensor histidine kinase ChvG